jgi:hypothetical protein
MKKYIWVFLVIIFILFIAIFYVYEMDKDNTTGTQANIQSEEYVVDPSDMYKISSSTTSTTKLELTTNELKWLIFMREEEKLARDVYTVLGDKWKLNIFSNIADSEQTHTDAVKDLLATYKIDDPVISNEVGVFSSPIIQKLYDDLIAQGYNSSLDALIVGAIIEDLDISDLDKAISETNKTEILSVYENLQKGSRNHLRAFVKNIEKIGGDYDPEYISQDVFDNIISSSQERGRI